MNKRHKILISLLVLSLVLLCGYGGNSGKPLTEPLLAILTAAGGSSRLLLLFSRPT